VIEETKQIQIKNLAV